jgi:type VI secretion system protein ImpL
MKAFFGGMLVILALVFFSLVIWFGGPYLSIAEYVPLESAQARLIAIAAIVVLWGLRALWREIKSARASRNLVKAVVKQEDPTSARGSADTRQMQQRFDEAIEVLQKSNKGKKSLYDLPWYIIIGPPGVGKTTVIVNSGLNFPLSQKFGKEALRGVGGTRNCDWWFTDQAILLDTAGRYTTQDSDQSSDAAGWLGFLGLLRKYRKRRPINGVLVAMSIADLATQSDAERTRHVASVRERLAELNKELNITLPVYLILTKGDLLAGFNEFFEDLQQDGRAQVWGATFPLEASRAGQAPDLFETELDLLIDRLNGRLLARMDAERDVNRRALIFGFPRQLAGTRRPLVDFVTETFGGSAYEQGVLLRGVYITSGTQEGTPVDRMLGALARTFGLGVKAVSSQGSRGKAYFIQRLLMDVVFKESGLAGVNRRMEMRQALGQAAVYIGVAAITILGGLAFAISYQQNQAYLAEVQRAVKPLQAFAGIQPPPDQVAELPRLDAYHDTLVAANEYTGSVPFSMRFGLYQGGSLGGAALDAYIRELNAGLTPAVAAMFRNRMEQLAREPDKLYEYLKIYLMLGSPQHLVPAELNFIADREWRLNYASDPAVIERLQTHLAALMEAKGRVQPLSLDADMVDRARTSLQQASVPVLMYSRLKLGHAGDAEHSIHLDKEIGLNGEGMLIRKSGIPLSDPIPGLYTRAVFNDVATTGKYEVAKDILSESWVLGLGAVSPTETANYAAGMMRLYEDDYIRIWDAVVADIGTRPTTGTQDLSDMMALLSSPTSPLKRFLVVVENNTNLLKPPDPSDKIAGAKATIAATVASKVNDLQNMFGSSGGPAVEKPGTRTTKHFETLNKLVDGPPGGAPIDQTLHALSQIQQQIASMGGGLGDTNALTAVTSPGQASAVEQLRIAAMQLPAPIAAIVSQVGSKGESVAKAEAGAELARRYKTEVAGECQQLIAGRYPFVARGTNDVALADFGRVFGPGGVFDTFFRERLAPLVDTSTNPWRWKQGAADIGGSASLLTQFQAADRIRQIYFPPGAQLPGMHFSLTPESLDSAVPRLAIDIEGQSIEYRHGPLRSQSLAWPGPSPGQASVLFEESGGGGPNRAYQGAWALFHLLDDASIQPQSDVRYLVTLTAGSRTARVTLDATSVRNPFARNELRSFRCGT